MKMKNDCQVDHIKEAFDKLYNCVMPYIDLTQFADARTAFQELDKKVHSEIYILKKCLAESDRAVEAGITKSKVLQERIHELEGENASLRETPFDTLEALKKENSELKTRNERLNTRCKSHWKALFEATTEAAQYKKSYKSLSETIEVQDKKIEELEAKINTLKKKIQDLETENANLRVTPFDTLEALKKENGDLKMRNFCLVATCETRRKCLSEAREEVEQYKKSFMVHREENNRLREVIDGKEKEINSLKKKIHELEQETADDAIRIKSLERANSVLRGDNETLWSKLEECDIPTREQASYKSLAETIEFQNKKIEELEAEKARLKEAYDIQETTTKKENVDLSPGHDFKFGDEVFVPWSDQPYMYVKRGLMYNPRTERLVYVGKDQHLKWFGEKFAIV